MTNETNLRLQQQYEAFREPAYVDGRRKGREWAEQTATARQLWALSTKRDRYSPAAWAEMIPDLAPDQPIEPARRAAGLLEGTNGGSEASLDQARKLFAPLGIAIDADAVVFRGFVDGALAVWRAAEVTF